MQIVGHDADEQQRRRNKQQIPAARQGLRLHMPQLQRSAKDQQRGEQLRQIVEIPEVTFDEVVREQAVFTGAQKDPQRRQQGRAGQQPLHARLHDPLPDGYGPAGGKADVDDAVEQKEYCRELRNSEIFQLMQDSRQQKEGTGQERDLSGAVASVRHRSDLVQRNI